MAHNFDYTKHLPVILDLLKQLEKNLPLSGDELQRLKKKYPQVNGHLFSQTDLITAYRALAGSHGLQAFNPQFVAQLQMKPIRTSSGVAPVTVLTKPYPCPGNCLFCPNDLRMPKSYLADEPGAQRAERNFFDPYLQVYRRLESLQAMGHTIDKVELIVLGGTWDYYPLAYQIWFIKECFRAMNEFGVNNDCQKIEQLYENFSKKSEQLGFFARSSNPEKNQIQLEKNLSAKNKTQRFNQIVEELYLGPEKAVGLDIYQQADWADLEVEQATNQKAQKRCVGLVLETRPDRITPQRVLQLRRLGCTKVQIGVQSLDDEVLAKNQRGHTVAQTKQAFALLRLAGFKIHIHWMANLYGSDPQKDQQDYLKIFADPAFRPDEIKIYPCSLLASAPLVEKYQQGLWQPYTEEELLAVVSFALQNTPAYCRITRVIRDIPSQNIVVGNKKTNFRQIAQDYLAKLHQESQNIRAREIRREQFNLDDVVLDQIVYETAVSQEIFLQFILKNNQKILAFLRLSLPKKNQPILLPELNQSAMIREVHVYGVTAALGKKDQHLAQHGGFGSKLIIEAKKLAQAAGYQKLAVISAIGTKEYYQDRGFNQVSLYQICDLVEAEKKD